LVRSATRHGSLK